ncbi:ATP synthase F1 subunit gamma [Portibacter marinus]|uniref:ATP synthase F1 subunit gamma n=1 Tax=Portibacter marinus TaxID=2898660 RepID=UPI001F3CDC64|nr:ATP synthase F1 subunit gamma [Portibacter marinus]
MSGALKEVRDRIKSIKNTQQITSAMKMVSAAKLRRAQQAITELRPYSDRLDLILKNVISNLGDDASTSLGVERPVERAVIVVVTSSRGLCGAFNTNIIKETIKLIEGDLAPVRASGKLSMVFVGKKGYDYFKKRYTDCDLNTEYLNLFSDLEFENVAELANEMISKFETADIDKVYVTYGRFKNAALQFAESVQFLPVEKIEPVNEAGIAPSSRADYIFEPGKKELLDELIPSILRTSMHKYMLDTHASEHGARMTAMDNATENAEELVKELKISYNKARQEAITKELSEIVGGAAALEG